MFRVCNYSKMRASVLSPQKSNCFVSSAAIGILFAASAATASITTIDLTHYPDGTPVPDETIVTDQYRDIGIIFSGRQPNGQPLSLVSVGGGWLFNTPDVYGAVYHFDFVDPGTTTPAFVDFFSISPNFDSNSESLDLVGLSDTGNDLKVVTVNASASSTWTPIISISPDPGNEFASIEIRTRGNPGIAFGGTYPDAFQFELVTPEPASLPLLLLAGVPLLRRRRR